MITVNDLLDHALDANLLIESALVHSAIANFVELYCLRLLVPCIKLESYGVLLGLKDHLTACIRSLPFGQNRFALDERPDTNNDSDFVQLCAVLIFFGIIVAAVVSINVFPYVSVSRVVACLHFILLRHVLG